MCTIFDLANQIIVCQDVDGYIFLAKVPKALLLPGYFTLEDLAALGWY